MAFPIYIDGKSGTTGLQIYERIGARKDLELLLIDENKRHDPVERARLMNAADLVFLCLPDAAAKEAVSLITNPETKVIDCSTAHRTNPDWTYGFAELSYEHKAAIQTAKRVANPGCHATGFISIVYPLVKLGIIHQDASLTAFSLTGYSGGGKNMIAEYESSDKPESYFAPRQYGLNGNHKHLPEMTKVCGLTVSPVFAPIVDDYYKGMEVSVPVPRALNNGFTAEQVKDMLFAYYRNTELVSVTPEVITEGMLSANTFAGSDHLEISVCGNDDRLMIVARFDNLGKGASGAAVQNMNLMLGLKETEGLK